MQDLGFPCNLQVNLLMSISLKLLVRMQYEFYFRVTSTNLYNYQWNMFLHLLFLFYRFVFNMFRETFSLNSADFVMKCPGHYCGRIELGSNNYSDCGACPRGYRAELSICKYCDDKPELYDWLYLGFMSLLPLVLHWFCIDNVSPLVVK